VNIEDDVSIAHGVTIMSTSHVHEGINTPIRDQGVSCDSVHIENNTWIGAKVTITAGVTVASGCVIGANAVVTKNTERNGVYVGIPAKKIKER
jgi:acetyltransferase-like isoleucine patch superfamily enzyme